MLRAHHCLLCGDPLPAGSRIDRQYCRDSCRTLASRVRKGKRRTPAVSGQTLLQHISPTGVTEQRPLSPLLALAVKHEDQEAELRVELAETRARLERLQREAEAEKQKALTELRQRLAEKDRAADEQAAENRSLRQALEVARQQLVACQEQAAIAQRAIAQQQTASPASLLHPEATANPAPVQPPPVPLPAAASPVPPPRRRLEEVELNDLAARVLQRVEHASLTDPRHTPEELRLFFARNQQLLMLLSMTVAHKVTDADSRGIAALFEPEPFLLELEQQVARRAASNPSAMTPWFSEHHAMLRLVVDETVQAVRRAMHGSG